MKTYKTTRRAAVATALLTAIATGWWLLSNDTKTPETHITDAEAAVPVVPVSNPGTKEEMMNKARDFAQKKELLFVQNSGQVKDDHGAIRSDIDFTAESGNLRLYLDAGRISYVFTQHEQAKDSKEESAKQELSHHNHTHSATEKVKVWRMDMEVVGGAANPTVTATDTAIETRNYYVAGKSVQNVRTFRTVVYHGIYPQIDLRLRTSGKRMKYEFIVHPGGDVGDIQLRYNGGTATAIGDGSLRVENPLGYIIEEAPVTYQTANPLTGNEAAEPVESRFILKENTVRFGVDAYDHSKTLVIDPDVLWATLYGGSGSDEEYEGGVCAIDGNGNVVFGGNTLSTDFPVSAGALQATNKGITDVAIVKMNAIGGRIWATYIGGSQEDWIHGIAINSSNEIYLAGHTDRPADGAAEFPVGGGSAHQTARTGAKPGELPGGQPDRDAFLMKLNGNGGKIWATLYGGPQPDDAYGLTLDYSGNPVITGFTGSTYNISTDQNQSLKNDIDPTWDIDMYVAKFTPLGARTWGTYYGGTGYGSIESGSITEESYDIAATANRIVITGWTSSSDVPLGEPTKVYQTTNVSGISAFVAMFDNPNTGNPTLQWASYLGGDNWDIGYGVIFDGGDVIATGFTASTDFPTKQAITGQTTLKGDRDAFVTKLIGDITTIQANQNSQHLKWSTYLGGSGAEIGFDPVIDAQGKLWLAGWTNSQDFPTSGAGVVQTKNAGAVGTADAFLVQLSHNSTNVVLDWGTYFGGCGEDFGTALAIRDDIIVMVGETDSKDFPTTVGSFQPTLSGTASDLFVVRFGEQGDDWSTYLGGNSLDVGTGITTDRDGNVIVTGFTCSGDFPTTPGAYQEDYVGIYPQNDAFVAKFSPQGERLWITQYGGTKEDAGYDVGVDDAGNIVIVGNTESTELGTAGDGIKYSLAGGFDAFIAEFSPDGDRLWASYFGSTGADRGYGIAVAGNGTITIVGETSPGGNIPVASVAGVQSGRGGGKDGFVAKFNRSGTTTVSRTLLWSTYYGGTNDDILHGVDMDDNGTMVVAGETRSSNIGLTTGVIQTTLAGPRDAFAVKFGLEANGNDLGGRKWATLYGGSGSDGAYDVALDRNGDVVLVGETFSTNFPVSTDAHQKTKSGGGGSPDGFVVKLNGSTAASAVWGTYLGGSTPDYFLGVAIDPFNRVVAVGGTSSPNFPTAPVTQGSKTSGVNMDVIIFTLNSAGKALSRTFTGGSGDEVQYLTVKHTDVAVDMVGDVVTTGVTTSSDFPVTAGSFDESYNDGDGDAFVSKFHRDYEPELSTYYGGGSSASPSGNPDDYTTDVALDNVGNTIMTGYSICSDLPRQIGLGNSGGFDAIIAKIDPEGRVRWTAVFGGSGTEFAHSVAVDANDDIVVVGETSTNNIWPNVLPVTPPLQTIYGGGSTDGFVLKLDVCGSIRWATYYGGAGLDAVYSVAIGKSRLSGKQEDILITGITRSGNLPGVVPFGPPGTPGNVLNRGNSTTASDGFIARYYPTGNRIWASYYGGSQDDQGNGIHVKTVDFQQPEGQQEIIAVVGQTESVLDLPMAGNSLFPILIGKVDAWFAIFTDVPGNPPITLPSPILRYATYYGGHDDDKAEDVVIDGSGNIAFIGGTESFDFPTSCNNPMFPNESRAYQSTQGSFLIYDAFIVKFNHQPQTPALWDRFWATYYGGAGIDFGYAITADANNDLLIGGSTSSPNFPVVGAATLQKTYQGGGSDGFLAKLNGTPAPAPFTPCNAAPPPAGAGIPIWSGYLGGTAQDAIGSGTGAPSTPPRGGIVVDATNTLYTSSSTLSADFPIGNGPYRRRAIAGMDIAITKLKGDGAAILKIKGSSQPPAILRQPSTQQPTIDLR